MPKVIEGYKKWIAEPKRAKSREFDFGDQWCLTTPQPPWWKVSYIEATGELYARELGTDRYVVLEHFDSLAEVEARMKGWENEPYRFLGLWFPNVVVKMTKEEREMKERMHPALEALLTLIGDNIAHYEALEEALRKSGAVTDSDIDNALVEWYDKHDPVVWATRHLDPEDMEALNRFFEGKG